MKTKKMILRLNGKTTETFIGCNLNQIAKEIVKLKATEHLIIADSNTFDLYAADLCNSLLDNGLDFCHLTWFLAGEERKNLTTYYNLCRTAMRVGLDRQSLIIALGGGIVGDMAGFVAATYMRGIRWVNIPTTLLAMVDSSIGGKTGVNLARGKNLVGAIWQPEKIFISF